MESSLWRYHRSVIGIVASLLLGQSSKAAIASASKMLTESSKYQTENRKRMFRLSISTKKWTAIRAGEETDPAVATVYEDVDLIASVWEKAHHIYDVRLWKSDHADKSMHTVNCIYRSDGSLAASENDYKFGDIEVDGSVSAVTAWDKSGKQLGYNVKAMDYSLDHVITGQKAKDLLAKAHLLDLKPFMSAKSLPFLSVYRTAKLLDKGWW